VTNGIVTVTEPITLANANFFRILLPFEERTFFSVTPSVIFALKFSDQDKNVECSKIAKGGLT